MNCYGKFEIENRQLSMSKNSTNGFFDITYKTVIYVDENSDCEDKITEKILKNVR